MKILLIMLIRQLTNAFKSVIEYGEYKSDPDHEGEMKHKGFIGIMSAKEKVLLDKPIYLGWAILELSKLFIYDFWYNIIKPEFGDNARLVIKILILQ